MEKYSNSGVKLAAALLAPLMLTACVEDNTANPQTSMEQVIFHTDGSVETNDFTYICSGTNLVRATKGGFRNTTTFMDDAACADQKLTPVDMVIPSPS